jgi:hypothetical protein
MYAQNVSRGKDFVINENLPFIYVKFDYMGPGEQRGQDESSRRIWLRLVNNCKFPIVLRTYGVPDESAKEEVGVMYDVVANPVLEGMVQLGPAPAGSSAEPTGNEVARPSAESESTEIPKGTIFHVSSTEVVPPGKNVLFSIPVNHVSKKWHLEIPFTFDLPNGKGPRDPSVGGEPILTLQYGIWDLPSKIRIEIEKK